MLELNDKATPEAVNQQQTELKYQIGWKTYDDSPKNQFDEKKYKNDKIKLKYQLVYEYVDNAGNTHEIVDDQFTEQEFEVGKTQDIVVDRNEVETRLKAKNPNIKELTKVNDMMLTTLGNETNPYWGASKTGTNEGYARFNIQQNMNTHMTYEKEDGALILDEDKDNLNLKHSVKKTYKGNEDWATSNDSKPIYGKDKFQEGKSKYLAQKDSRLSYATRNNSLGMYSAYTGKYKTYRFVTEFDGKDKDRLSKYYNLTVEGNDLEGWTVTLGSNLKEETLPKDRKLPYTTETVYDSNLEEGTTIVEREEKMVLLEIPLGESTYLEKMVKKILLKKK